MHDLPSIHGQNTIITKVIGDELRILSKTIIMKSPRSKRKLGSLINQSLDNLGMTMPLIHGRIGAEEIIIFFPINVVEMDACASFEDDGEGMVVVGAVFGFLVYHFDGGGGDSC